MQKIIFVTSFDCELCGHPQPVQLYGDTDSSFTPEHEPELIEWAKHFHWCGTHRVCAVCGKLVMSEELELAVNDGSVKIHQNYTDHYMKVKTGEKLGHLLIIHSDCIKITKGKNNENLRV